MSMQILATKLYIPSSRPKSVLRPHLIKQLDEGLDRKLSLISAPAGFGKTNLVSEWVANCARQVAWVSLDEGDNVPARFLSYIISAIQTIAPNIGDTVRSVLQSPQAPPIETLLTTLLNEIATISDDFILVLDDYHLIDSPPIDKILSFLLKHLPSQINLVIITREDPNLPLARLRARNQLTELRVADLRFTASESAEFLNQVMGLKLSAGDIDRLETRTEGWIVGLQLAAISMQSQADKGGFIDAFSGNHQFVIDYLVEEVLQQQSDDIQNFLLQTSILERFCDDLCNAVVADTDSQRILDYLTRANLFLIPLDYEGKWFRYHHLFSELLRQRLNQSQIDVNERHIRASQWYEDNGFEIEAFQHATIANDIERAVHLIEGEGIPLIFRGIVYPVLNWLNSLPITVLNARPSLWIWSAHASTYIGEATGIEQKLEAAETALGEDKLDSRSRNFIGHIAAIRAMLAVPYNQTDNIIYESRRALEYLHVDNLYVRTSASWTLGYGYQTQGKRGDAIQAYSEVISMSKASGDFMNMMAATICLGQVQESENLLDHAIENYHQAVQMAGDLPYSCEAYLGLARIAYERSELDIAEQYVQQAIQLAQQIDNVDTPARCWMVLARIKLAQGDVSGALNQLATAEQFILQRNFVHQIPELAEMQVLTLLYQGNLTGAYQLVVQHDIPLTKARLHIAQGNPSTALTILEPLHKQMEAKGWQDKQLKAMILETIALYSLNKQDDALQLLGEALSLAQPAGLVRSFLDEGEPMLQLLSLATTQGNTFDYVGKLLANQANIQASDQPLIEPLSDRELEILQLIADGLSNREISEQLFLALDTIKGHNRRIFGKLQVKRRTEAVATARDLGLI